ncbi:MAG TPA: hypothetical protein VN628_12610 [Vicinamibacterales bacterium]|nr:hypothetical protein [Vicinamibacterales bacterium]
MFWWFERGGTYLRCEAVPASVGGFELRVVEPDGRERVELCADSVALSDRQREVIEEITRAGWNGPHGWNV